MRKRWLEVLHRMAVKDERIVFLGSDLSADPTFRRLKEAIPGRFYMEGISEAHLIGMASGLAMSGKIVYVNTIATFITRRCYEQNAIDLGLAKANVRLIGGGGGLVYGPLGPTHLAIEDIAIMRSIPNMAVAAPVDADEMERVMLASVDHQGPLYIRVAKGGDPILSKAEHGFKIGQAIVHRAPAEITLLTTGTLLGRALAVADDLAKEGLECGVVHFPTLKPFDTGAVLKAVERSKVVLSLEEHVVSGGLGSMVAECIAEMPSRHKVGFRRMGLPDFFPDTYGSQDFLLDKYGLSGREIMGQAKGLLAEVQ